MKKITLICTAVLILLTIMLNVAGCLDISDTDISSNKSSLTEKQTNIQSTQKIDKEQTDKHTQKAPTTDKESMGNQQTTEKATQSETTQNKENTTVYVLNTDSKKIHYSSCSAAKRISNENRRETTDSISSLVANGYTECGICMK
jgi:hypothetical protein